MVIDGTDRATFVWSLYSGADPTLQIAQRPADESIGSALGISSHTVEPQIAVAPNGSVTIVAVRYPSPPNGSSQVLAIHIDPNGGTISSHTVFSQAGSYAEEPQVVVDAQGRATVVWSSHGLGMSRVESVRLEPDGTPETVQTLSDTAHSAHEARVAVDQAGRATVAWTGNDGSNARVQALRIAADGIPGAAQMLSPAGAEAFDLDLAVDPQGLATVVWRKGPEGDVRVQAVRIGDDGAPGSVQTLSGPVGVLSHPAVTVDSQGRAWVLWSRQEGDPEDFRWSIQATRIAADDGQGPVLTLSDASASEPDLAIDSQDRAWVVWRDIDGAAHGTLKAVRIAADGSPGPVQVPDSSGSNAYSPRLAIDSLDRPTLAWSAPNRIAVSEGEFAPPDTQIDAEGVVWPGITFSFSSPDLEVDGFECSLDYAVFAPCESPVTYSPALDVSHTFEVRAEGEGGADPSPAGSGFSFFSKPPEPKPASPAIPGVTPPPIPMGPLVMGIARAAAVSHVGHGLALLTLRCSGPSRCQGYARLSLASKGREITIGSSRFDLQPGGVAQLAVRLSAQGGRLLGAAPGGRLWVHLSGSGLYGRGLMLKEDKASPVASGH